MSRAPECPATPRLRRSRAAMAAVALATLVGGTDPAAACPSGPRPTGNDARYVAACAGQNDEVVLIRPPSGPLTLGTAVSATDTHSAPFGLGHVEITASVGTSSNFILNPDLHASVIGYADSTDRRTGEAGGNATASFRDIVRFKGAPFETFILEYAVTGNLVGTYVSSGAAFGQAIAVLNLGISRLDGSGFREGFGLTLDTEAGQSGPFDFNFGLSARLQPDRDYVLSGSLDVRAYGYSAAGAGVPSTFAADFGSTMKFMGFRFYTDDTYSTEVQGVIVESAFGFDYRVADDGAPTVVPAPSSLLLLASGIGLVAAWRRRGHGRLAHPRGNGSALG